MLISNQFGTSFLGTLECSSHCVKTQILALGDTKANSGMAEVAEPGVRH